MIPRKFTMRKSWIISPFGNNYHDQSNDFSFWVPILAIVPAALVFIILFFEVELTGFVSFEGSNVNLQIYCHQLLSTHL